MGFFTDFIRMAVVINPFSKMLVSTMMSKKIRSKKDIREIINYSNLVGFLMLVSFAIFGPFLFKNLLGVSDAALTISCGISLIIFGINYLFKDEVYNFNKKSKTVMYLSIGVPMIAGPASISTITIISSYSSILYSIGIVALAMATNYILMIVSYSLTPSKEDDRLRYLNIRLTGLFMLSVGVQFLLNGIKGWM